MVQIIDKRISTNNKELMSVTVKDNNEVLCHAAGCRGVYSFVLLGPFSFHAIMTKIGMCTKTHTLLN